MHESYTHSILSAPLIEFLQQNAAIDWFMDKELSERLVNGRYAEHMHKSRSDCGNNKIGWRWETILKIDKYFYG